MSALHSYRRKVAAAAIAPPFHRSTRNTTRGLRRSNPSLTEQETLRRCLLGSRSRHPKLRDRARFETCPAFRSYPTQRRCCLPFTKFPSRTIGTAAKKIKGAVPFASRVHRWIKSSRDCSTPRTNAPHRRLGSVAACFCSFSWSTASPWARPLRDPTVLFPC